ncbi:DUF2796 domain-containing protein [Tropicimonas sp. TH_r6]|uniref:zinc uptake protein ZrgA n=1 Tax=Tropicimonas sp. TH_r6 TaxID=3082085 RepID=UPI0029551579|nr:DUF2796 domain-containing protein [Tropicimonas sp. TH_r6]MDV7145163.1 DUF2796 domain-containing protein [Tropicimonas sp. TH_r6]
MTASRLAILAVLCAGAATAQEMEQHAAHVHGTGALDIAVEGNVISMELRAPGADIVGFEHAAQEDEDKAAIAAALEILSHPETLFVPNEAAGCDVTSAEADLHTGEGHHDDHDDGDHEEHAEDGHDAHEDEHDEAHEDEHAHEGQATHSEFHAEYAFTCAHPEKLTQLALPFFEAFERSEQLEIRLITGKGAQSETLPRDAAGIALEGHL